MSNEESVMTESNEVPELIIHNEEEAWEALDAALRSAEFPSNLRLRFEGWPSFELDVKGRDWHSTVPTRVMPALLDLQRDINRAYATIQYDEPNLRRLREEERDELEVVVKVKKGSSIFDADLWQQFTAMAQAAVGRMNGNEIVITTIGLALAIIAPVMFKAWLSARQHEKDIASRVELSEQETKRLQIMAEAMRQQPAIKEVQEDAAATANKLLKATRPGDTMEISGVSVTSEEARELVQPERDRAQNVEIDGVFSILGVRTDKSDGFRITLRRESDQLTFNADVPIELDHTQQEIIQKAEWSKSKVRLSIEAERLRDSITHAVVFHAATITESD